MANWNNFLIMFIGIGVGIFGAMLLYRLSQSNRGVSISGKPMQISPAVFDRPTGNELSINVRFPNDANGIIMFAKNPKGEFQILYVRDGSVFMNTNNDPDKSLLLFGKSKKNYWRRFEVPLLDSLVTSPVFIGGFEGGLPNNTVVPQHSFPTNGLVCCINIVVNGKSDVTKDFLKRGLKECWGF
jgi:hypothetical protein